MGAVFLSERHGGVCFPFLLHFLVCVGFDHEGVTSAPDACVSQKDKLLPGTGFFRSKFTSIAEHFVYWIKCMFPWVLTCYWMVFLVWASFKLSEMFQPSRAIKFCISSRIPGRAFFLFPIGRNCVCQKISDFSELAVNSLCWNGPAKELNLFDSKMALLYFQFQSCLANALENCLVAPGKIRIIVGCTHKIVHVLSTLVSFDNWIGVFTHEF